MTVIAVDGAISIRSGRLRASKADPANRIVVTTALEGHRLATEDQGILDWPGLVRRLDAS